MNNNGSDYEELKRQGYTEEEIELKLDGVSRMKVYDSPLGEGREDKGVNVTDSQGRSRRTSSIMLGYNNDGITLENGEYVSWEEAQERLEESLSSNAEEVTFVRRDTGEKVTSAEIVAEIFQRSTAKTHLSHEPTDKMGNQQAAQMTVHDGTKGDFPKGVSMLGNDGIQLSSGVYVSRAVVEQALSEYAMLRAPGIVPTPPGSTPKSEPQEDKKYTLINKIRKDAASIAVAVALAIEMLAGFGKEVVIDQHEFVREADKLSYSITEVADTKVIHETSNEVAERLLRTLTTGESIVIDVPAPYYESSDYNYGGADRKGTIGQSSPYGDYELEGFSILVDGQIRKVEFGPGQDLATVMEQVSNSVGKPIHELEPMVHLVGPNGAAGWVKCADMFSQDEKTPQLKDVEVILDENATYDGVIEDFQGDTITINNGVEDVTIRVKNEDGSFVQSGDIVVGSDGQEYQMTDLEVTETDVIDYAEEKTGTRVNWSLKNITLEEHLAAAAVAIVGTALSARKKKEMVDMTQDQIDTLIDAKHQEFQQAKGAYEGNSAFHRATETLVGKQIQPPLTAREVLDQELKAHNITVEDIQTLSEGGRKRK